jgi:hypothetical protein
VILGLDRSNLGKLYRLGALDSYKFCI